MKPSACSGTELVSVVIPCYNQAHFLGEAIESVLAQSYPHFEIIVVDDGSLDNTSEVATRYPKVRCIRQNNQGVAAARNAGLHVSEGTYLVFLDADDRLLPDALEVGLECLEAYPECAFVSGKLRIIAADGSPLPVWKQQPCPDKEHYLEMLRANYVWLTAVVVYRRSVLEVVGGFDASVSPAEDYELCLRIARDYPVFCHGKVVAEYRQHGSSMSRNSVLMLKVAYAVLDSQKEHVRGSKRHEKAIKEGVRVAQDKYGGQLAYKVLAHVRRREWKQAMWNLLVLLRYYPFPLFFVRAYQELRLPRHLRRWPGWQEKN